MPQKASMGPRLVSRGKPVRNRKGKEILLPLQWGRDLLVAERLREGVKANAVSMLQWGRDLLVAESSRPNSIPISARLLQWGRDLLVAEREAQ